MAPRYSRAAAALILSATVGFLAHQAQAGNLMTNLRLIKPWGRLVSSADPLCAPKWVKHAQNDPALRCYLKVNPERFCNDSERLHLAMTLCRYRWDAVMLQLNTVMAVVKPMNMPAGTPEQWRAANGQPGDEPFTKEQLLAIRAITEKRMENIAKARPATLDAALELDSLPKEELVGPLQSIARSGLMLKGDFGWWPGALVDEAFEGVSTPAGACADTIEAGQPDGR